MAITIQDSGFHPQTFTIPVGTMVTWTNLDSFQHQISNSAPISGPVQIFASRPLGKGDTYSFTFTTAGVYRYVCALHSEDWGIITVE